MRILGVFHNNLIQLTIFRGIHENQFLSIILSHLLFVIVFYFPYPCLQPRQLPPSPRNNLEPYGTTTPAINSKWSSHRPSAPHCLQYAIADESKKLVPQFQSTVDESSHKGQQSVEGIC